MLETLTRRVERAKDGNDYLREAVNDNSGNGKRVGENINTKQATINNLLEKMNSVEKKNEERMEKVVVEVTKAVKASEDIKVALSTTATANESAKDPR